MPHENCTGLAANLSISPCAATQEAEVGQEECQVVKELVSKVFYKGRNLEAILINKSTKVMC